MNATSILPHSPLDEARAEMERMAREAMVPERARGWWHAARIVRTFGNAARAMKQHAQQARFFAESLPEKAAAYREAMVILARHTGESLVVDAAGEEPVRERAFDLGFSFSDDGEEGARGKQARSSSVKKKRKQKQKQKRGSGSMGWRDEETRGGSVVVAGLSSGAFPGSRPSHRSRSSLHGPDLSGSGFIPFIGG